MILLLTLLTAARADAPFPWSHQPAELRDALARDALGAELARARDLTLPEGAAPWFVSYTLVDGQYYTAFAEHGALVRDQLDPMGSLRVEVRTGDERLDSANFSGFGEPEGVVTVGLPHERDVVALRHAAWLATDAAYKQAVEQLSRKQAALAGQPASEQPTRAMNPVPPVVSPAAEPVPLRPDLVREAVRHLSAVLAETPELEAAQAVGREWQGTRLLMSSEGMALSVAAGVAVVRVEGAMRLPDGTLLRDGRWWVADSAGDLPPLAEMEAEVRALAAWLVALQDAEPLKEYLGPVLFEGPASVELFRQLVASEMVGTPPALQAPDPTGVLPRRRASGRAGRRLLPEGWTLVDDPTVKEATGDYVYDHEGAPAQRVVVVEDGVVRRLLHSRVPAGPDDGSTGHGRSLGGARVTAVPSIVQVEPRRARSERALRRRALRLAAQTGHDQVLVIRRLEPPAMTEDFDVFFTGEGPPPGLTPPYEAWLLSSDGSVTPVRGLRFVGVDRRALRDIVLAGEVGPYVGVLDAEPGPGRFLIGPVGGLSGAWSVPPVLISELELSGGEGGEARQIPPPPRAP